MVDGGKTGPSAAASVGLPITLGRFMKLAGLVSTGGEAKQLVAEGRVLVNTEVETRRGRKLADGDVVEVHGRAIRLVAHPSDPTPSGG
ncbi:MAG: RNA-binding S4 domain-containing protein [Actinobacteria bacterium]|jgi:ribosome-associated protein|nr:RNA-binding S4 domain-containing protein [Actinomycetota bacterium]